MFLSAVARPPVAFVRHPQQRVHHLPLRWSLQRVVAVLVAVPELLRHQVRRQTLAVSTDAHGASVGVVRENLVRVSLGTRTVPQVRVDNRLELLGLDPPLNENRPVPVDVPGLVFFRDSYPLPPFSVKYPVERRRHRAARSVEVEQVVNRRARVALLRGRGCRERQHHRGQRGVFIFQAVHEVVQLRVPFVEHVRVEPVRYLGAHLLSRLILECHPSITVVTHRLTPLPDYFPHRLQAPICIPRFRPKIHSRASRRRLSEGRPPERLRIAWFRRRRLMQGWPRGCRRRGQQRHDS